MRHTIKNKAFAILFMAMLLSPSALAKNDWSIPLAICYNKKPIIDGINRNHRPDCIKGAGAELRR